MRYLSRNNGRAGLPMVWLLALGLPLVAGACKGNALQVVDPERATPANLTPDVAFAGALSDFQQAYSGHGLDDEILSTVADFTDEMYSSGTFSTRTHTDQRDQFTPQNGNTTDAAYGNLHIARASAVSAQKLMADASAADPRISELKSYIGYDYTAMGENFCSNIPFSSTENFAPTDLGTPLTTAQMFSAAADTFDAAISAAKDNQRKYLAMVGKARALLDNGDYAGAAAAVSSVPTDFIFLIYHNAAVSADQNPIFNLMSNGRYSVANGQAGTAVADPDGTGGNGLNFRSANDPRVPWAQDPSGGFDQTIPQYVGLRYPLQGSNVVLADGIEARLIEAEAALNNGDPGTWLSKLNALRADVQNLLAARYDPPEPNDFGFSNQVTATSLPAITDPGTPAARVDTMFRERAFWLYATGHRLGDLRRLIRQYGRNEADVFPSGPYYKGGTFGTDVAFQIAFNEQNNTNYQLSMCDVSQP
jgi:hypothetical protein